MKITISQKLQVLAVFIGLITALFNLYRTDISKLNAFIHIKIIYTIFIVEAVLIALYLILNAINQEKKNGKK